MSVATGTLFLSFAVFLNSIELISSVQLTLAQLFPGSNGIDLPPMEELPSQDTQRYRNFQRFEHHQMHLPISNFLKRGHVIFAYKNGYVGRSLIELFNTRHENRFIIFDTSKDKWVTLYKPDFEKLGPTRNLLLMYARDEAVALHKLDPRMMHPVNYEAIKKTHEIASEAAYIAANNVEYKYRFKEIGRTVEGTLLVKQAYDKAYREAYAQAYVKYSG